MRTPGFDDIVFAHHNKKYGAYILRKRYITVLLFSTLIASVLFSGISLLAFYKSPKKGSEKVRTVQFVVMDNLEPPAEQFIIDPPPPPPPPQGNQMSQFSVKSLKFVAPEVVDSITPQQVFAEDIGSSDDTTGVIASKSGDYGISSGTGTNNGIPGGTGTGDWYLSAEIMPTFKGGDIEKFREWVMNRTKYPQYALTNNIQGKVYISFIVETDGTVSTVMIAKGVDSSLDNEAKKVVSSSPKWAPGKTAGMAVRVKYLIAIDFRL